MSSQTNPLQAWAGLSGANQPPQQPGASGVAQQAGNLNPAQSPLPPNVGAPSATTNPYGFGVRGNGNLTANLAETNLQTGVMKNQLIPQYAQMFGALGGNAANYFQQLMNLGSPYYQQAQQSVFNQGVQQANSQAGQARQQLGAQGYGFGPSGAMAGMLGGMATGTSGNLAQNFLNQLFQNEQLQSGAASGMASLASQFNPAQLTGQQTNPAIQQPTNTAAEMLGATGQLLSGAAAGTKAGSQAAGGG